jgi:hypothetical protein
MTMSVVKLDGPLLAISGAVTGSRLWMKRPYRWP